MRVFLTSDSVPGAQAIRDQLELLGHQVQEPTTLGAGALLAAAEWSSDVVVAVLWQRRPPRQRREAILVEVGIALGRGLPVLLVSRRGLALPALVGVSRIDTDLNSAVGVSLLKTQLSLFLRGAQLHPPHWHPPTIRPSGVSTGTRPAPQTAGLEFEEQVGAVLRATGSEVLAEVQLARPDDGADFAVYFPPHESGLGIVLVEAKQVTGPHASRRLREAADQLSQRVLSAHAGVGLLVHSGRGMRLPSYPLVVTMSLEELSGRLEAAPLPEVLRQARNEAIHAL